MRLVSNADLDAQVEQIDARREEWAAETDGAELLNDVCAFLVL